MCVTFPALTGRITIKLVYRSGTLSKTESGKHITLSLYHLLPDSLTLLFFSNNTTNERYLTLKEAGLNLLSEKKTITACFFYMA